MLRDASLKTMFELIDEHRIPFHFVKSEYRIHLTECDSHILCRSVENFDRLRGTNLAWFALDETSYCPEMAWLQLEARLRDPLAKEKAGCGAWTPKGHDWIYRKFVKQERPNPQYQAVLANPRENTYIDASFYDGLLASYSPNFARQEVLGEYLNVFTGRAYQDFQSEPEGNIWRVGDRAKENWDGFRPCVYERTRPLLWSLDFNISPATSVIAQTVSQTPGYHLGPNEIGGRHAQLNVLDEIFIHNIRTEQHVEAFHAKVLPQLKRGGKLRVIVYGDASGERRQSSASKSDYAILREFFVRHNHEFDVSFRVPQQNPLVVDRVNSVNALCKSHSGNRRLAVHQRCKELIRDLEEVSWAQDSSGNLQAALSTKQPDRNHVSDALGYLVHYEMGIRPKSGMTSHHIH
jgi:hypothetical protein